MSQKPDKPVKNAISPARADDYPEWYQQVIKAADMADNSPVRGCMVIKPWGYAIWENIQDDLDARFKATGHQNAYFPLFIPMSFLEKEAAHVEGFAKECAVVTHSRLQMGADGKLHPASPLDEPLIVRPTSETIIGEMFAKWVQSYRDLPLLINQWANVVRWELRTRLFLRTTEFLWQEGHTVHATEECAMRETRLILDLYADFAENVMAMPVIKGEKTAAERFPGAVNTFCIEAMMQDRKALQAGTSHYLGQNFAKAANIQFLNEQGVHQLAHTTSWGVSTRLIGGLIMTHSDDDGLVLPPRLAPSQIVIMPLSHKEETRAAVLAYCDKLKAELEAQRYAGEPVRVKIDNRDLRGGEKKWEWVKKGVPFLLEIGPRDVEGDGVFLSRRDKAQEKGVGMKRADLVATIADLLGGLQQGLLDKARAFQKAHTREIDSKEEFYAFFTAKNPDKPEIHAGFALTHYDGSVEVEEKIKEDLKVTVRCIPLDDNAAPGLCPFTGKPSQRRVVWGKSY